MASQSNIEFRVGLTVLLGIVLLGVSLYWLQGYRLEHNSDIIMVRFNDVGTLALGDKVTVSGVHRGKVNKLRLTDSGVLVELLVYQGVTLHKDATFTIKNLGVMGERFIAIDPGHDSASFDYNQVVSGHYDIGIPEVMGKLGEMITELRNLVSSLKSTVASDSALNKFNLTVNHVEHLTASLSDYIDRNQGKLDDAAGNFLEASSRLNQMVTRNARLVDSTSSRVERVSLRFEQFVGQLDSLAGSARRFADVLDNEDGSLQLLVGDRRLYDDLRRTADNIDDLVQDIRKNPRKYINLKVELF